MFEQTTEDGQLKEELQRCADRNKMKLKMVEEVDNNNRRELQRVREVTCLRQIFVAMNIAKYFKANLVLTVKQ